jgi:hypothetical protein
MRRKKQLIMNKHLITNKHLNAKLKYSVLEDPAALRQPVIG